MNNPFTLEVSLKQHSPLIHFQHDQHGAALRATELKPKLDRFIIKNYFKDNFAQYKKYLVGYNEKLEENQYNHKALDYKIRINSLAPKVFPPHPLYFGNIGSDKGGKAKKMSVFSHEDIDVVIFCFKGELLKVIASLLPDFFAVTNFGTRQNKGFGSFYISEKSNPYYKDIETVLPEGTPFIKIDSKDDNEILSTIDFYYKRLKSGINPKSGYKTEEGYHKAFLYKYLLNNSDIKYTWEKQRLKETFLDLPIETGGREPKFARAMLGLPAKFFFKQSRMDIEVSSKNIARIKSPFTFKIIKHHLKNETRVFILLDHELIKQINDRVCREKQEFTFKSKSGAHKRKISLTLPEDIIDFDDLLKCYHQELDHTIKGTYMLRHGKSNYEPIEINARISTV